MKKALITLFIFATILCCGFLMSCNQTRIEDMVDISIVKLPDKLEYQFGEELNIDGIEVHLNYKKADPKILSKDEFVVLGYDAQKEGDQTLEVVYKAEDDDYQIEFKKYFQVKVYPLKGDLYFVEDFCLDKVYDGKSVLITENDYIKNSTADIQIVWYQGKTLLSNAPKNVGKYKAEISVPSVEGFESASASIEFEISPRELEVVWVGENGNNEDFDFTYTGDFVSPTPTVDTSEYGEKVFLVNDGSYAEVGENYSSICRMMVSNSNYILRNTTCYFNIVKASSNVQFYSDAIFEKTFDNLEAQMSEYQYEGDGDVEVKWYKNDELLNTSPINSGKYVVEVFVNETDNFISSSVKHEYVISKKQVEINWYGEGDSLDDFDWVYSNSEISPSANCNLVLGFNLDINVSGSAINAGEYIAHASILNDTYNNFQIVNSTKNFVISKADYDMSGITFVDETKPYAKEAQSLTISGALPVGLDGIGVTVQYEGETKNAGTSCQVRAIFSTLSTNYNIPAEMTANLTISKADRELTKSSDESIESNSINVAYIKSMLVYEQEDAVLILSIDGGEFVEEDSFVYSEGASIEVKIKESANYKESNSVTITVLISEV